MVDSKRVGRDKVALEEESGRYAGSSALRLVHQSMAKRGKVNLSSRKSSTMFTQSKRRM